MPFTAPEPSNRRPRIVGDAVIIGKSTIIARRYVLQGIWEVDKHHPVALSRLLSMAYGKRISSGSDMVKLLEKAAAALPRNPREADQLISGLPEPLAEAEEQVEEASRLLKDGVSPYRLAEALRGEQLGLNPAPAWTERLTLCDKGIVLGKGTVIVGLTDDGLDLEGKEGEVLALLSLARRRLAPTETLEKLASVSRAVMAGNISVAAITLAQLGQPPLQDEGLAKSLTFAANKLKRGVKPLELLKKAGFSRATLEKAYGGSAAWDESLHPRDEKGRFGNGNGGASSGSDTSTPAVDGQNLDRSDLTGRYGADASSTAPEKYSLDQQYAANDTGTKNDASGQAQSHSDGSRAEQSKDGQTKWSDAVVRPEGDKISDEDWEGMKNALNKRKDMSDSQKASILTVFAWEGGLKNDGGAVAGFTKKYLKDHGLSAPKTCDDAIALYVGYFDDSLKRIGRFKALSQFSDARDACLFADTDFRCGRNGGPTVMEEAINDVLLTEKGKLITVDAGMGTEVLTNYTSLISSPKTRQKLIDAMNAERIKFLHDFYDGDKSQYKGDIPRSASFK